MKSVKNILEQGRFEIPDNGFSARVMSAVAQRTSQPSARHTLPIRRLSTWREFRLPMIGIAAGVLLIGFITNHVLNWGETWGEDYLRKTELLSQQLFSSQAGSKDTDHANDTNAEKADSTPRTTDEY